MSFFDRRIAMLLKRLGSKIAPVSVTYSNGDTHAMDQFKATMVVLGQLAGGVGTDPHIVAVDDPGGDGFFAALLHDNAGDLWADMAADLPL